MSGERPTGGATIECDGLVGPTFNLRKTMSHRSNDTAPAVAGSLADFAGLCLILLLAGCGLGGEDGDASGSDAGAAGAGSGGPPSVARCLDEACDVPGQATPLSLLTLPVEVTREGAEVGAVRVLFSDDRGFEVVVPASSAHPVTVVVPPYLDPASGRFESGEVSVRVLPEYGEPRPLAGRLRVSPLPEAAGGLGVASRAAPRCAGWTGRSPTPSSSSVVSPVTLPPSRRSWARPGTASVCSTPRSRPSRPTLRWSSTLAR
jgi:hypothetical protein